MQDLVGKQFKLEQDSFRIVDVRNFSGNYMVYAEHDKVEAANETARRAFHFEDIAHLIPPARNA